MIVIRHEGSIAGNPWKQLGVISDERIVWFDMEPALLAGWNVKRVEVQGPDAWPGMDAASILAWKVASGRCEMASEGETAWAIARPEVSL